MLLESLGTTPEAAEKATGREFFSEYYEPNSISVYSVELATHFSWDQDLLSFLIRILYGSKFIN